ncbi:response regulator [Tahibacter amnicola]|uniref:Response regulator transcription factor n=1 Tax=Tahibacter amnicola TaxID=2976241 RepID=A0ABY6BDL0_9GAMM|nr:response regulator transcription factor [Tahibacter amnicola]UXI67318.1 response regulator transcription factor [Tahibacter amnicola]
MTKPAASETVRVIVADDHTLVRAGICRLLEGTPGVAVVGEASNADEALQLVDQHHPDVALIDLAMPGRSGLDLIGDLRARFPRTAVVVMSMHTELGYVRTSLERGASAYIVKDAAPAELEQALHAARHGQTFVSPPIAAQMLSAFVGRSKNSLDALSPRQREILHHIAKGEATKEIAAALGISVKTVETHRARMMDLLGIKRSSELLRFALQHNLNM